MRRARWIDKSVAPFFGAVLRQRRWDLDLRATDVARRVRVDVSTLYGWERGERQSLIAPHHFWALATVLELHPDEMLEAAGYKPSARFAGSAAAARAAAL